ncbi:MAG: bifunctional nuclease family protein [Anaerolineae bacterium]|nr:bifunctional nuclease family protein [Anaerolineae bacterium]
MVEVVIDSIRVSLMSQQRIVILRESQNERYLPIWIGPYEAEAITIALQDVEVSRPLTHDLLNNVFLSLEARVLRVEVTALKDEVYFGNIVVDVKGVQFNIDSRPSDALALAVRAHVPILVSTGVLESAGIIPEENLEDEAGNPPAPEYTSPEVEEEIQERLSVFEDFLDQLDFGGEEDSEEE